MFLVTLLKPATNFHLLAIILSIASCNQARRMYIDRSEHSRHVKWLCRRFFPTITNEWLSSRVL